jgi:hypothetical protein
MGLSLVKSRCKIEMRYLIRKPGGWINKPEILKLLCTEPRFFFQFPNAAIALRINIPLPP